MERLKGYIPAFSLGFLSAVDNVASGFAFAALLFPPTLAAGLGYGLGVILLSSIVIPLFLAIKSSMSNNVGMVQEEGFAILAIAVAAMLSSMSGVQEEVRIATVLVVLGLSSVLTGIFFVIFGYFKLGSLVRFLPFPVIAGFLAGTGWLLIDGGMIMVASEEDLLGIFHKICEMNALINMAASFAFAIFMYYALAKYSSPLVTPLVFIGATSLFFALISVFGVTIDEARSFGWLPSLSGNFSVSVPRPDQMYLKADWSAVWSLMPFILSAVFVNIIAILLNTSGLELALGQDRDANKELQDNGYANILAGVFCGPSGYLCLSTTLLADKMGLASRIAGVVIAVGTFGGLLFASYMIGYVPTFLPAGLMIFLGIELVVEWIYEAKHKISANEWFVVLAIVFVIGSVGFVEGLAFGILLSAISFVYDYSKLNIIKIEADASEMRSNVDRSSAQTHILNANGGASQILVLQGYLFFGTVENVVNRVKNRLGNADKQALEYLVLDFKNVSGMDSAATAGFIKISQALKGARSKMLFSNLSEKFKLSIKKAGVEFGEDTLDFSGLDYALEYCESMLLEEYYIQEGGDDVIKNLKNFLGNSDRSDDAIACLQKIELKEGDYLIKTNDEADSMFIVGSGQVSVEFVSGSGARVRLRTMMAGSIIGEIALCLGGKRTADVVVDTQTTAFMLSKSTLFDLERRDPELAFIFHKAISTALADKLVLTNKLALLGQK